MLIMITNSKIPYCYDIAYVIGLPHSFSYRFRYITKWINLPYSIQEIKGRDGLIVLRNFETAELIPIRYIRTEFVRSIGDINYIEFYIRDYYPLTKKEEAAEIINQALMEKGYTNCGGNPLDCLLLDVHNKIKTKLPLSEEIDDNQRWSEILKVIGGFDCYNDFNFLKIIQICDSKENYAAITKNETGQYSYNVKPDCLYFLEVIQQIPWKVGKSESIKRPYDVKLKAEKDEIIILRETQRVVGNYDLLRFIFKTTPGPNIRHTFLEVENEQGEEVTYGIPSLFLPIQITPPGLLRLMHWIKIGAQALAAVTIVVAEPLARYIPISAELIRGIALAIIVLASGMWDDLMKAFIKDAKEVKLK